MIYKKNYSSSWGLEDKYVFDVAKQKLSEVSLLEQPFALTLMTIDTHSGMNISKFCSRRSEYNYLDAILCSDSQVNNFIQWVQKQPFYQNTTLVIVGDHPTMQPGVIPESKKEYTRKVYTCYINASDHELGTGERREFSPFDIFPTTLASLGATIDGQRLGLGTNLFSNTETLTEKYGIAYQNEELSKKSYMLDQKNNIQINKEAIRYILMNPLIQERAFFFTRKIEKYKYLLTIMIMQEKDKGMEDVEIEIFNDINMKKYKKIKLTNEYTNMINGYTVNMYNTYIDIQENDDFYIVKAVGKSNSLGDIEIGNVTGDLRLKTKDFNSYIKNIVESLDKYIVFISSQKDISSLLNDETILSLQSLGVKTNLLQRKTDGFAAIIDGNHVVEQSSDIVTLDGTFSDKKYRYHIESNEKNNGSAVIILDGLDYAKKLPGMNIVVYNKKNGQIVDSAAFDGVPGHEHLVR